MRWPWTGGGPAKDDLAAMRRDVDDLRSELKRLRVEWDDMYEKIISRSERLRKREERAAAQNGEQGALPLALDRKAALRAAAKAQGVWR